METGKVWVAEVSAWMVGIASDLASTRCTGIDCGYTEDGTESFSHASGKDYETATPMSQ